MLKARICLAEGLRRLMIKKRSRAELARWPGMIISPLQRVRYRHVWWPYKHKVGNPGSEAPPRSELPALQLQLLKFPRVAIYYPRLVLPRKDMKPPYKAHFCFSCPESSLLSNKRFASIPCSTGLSSEELTSLPSEHPVTWLPSILFLGFGNTRFLLQ